MPQLECKNCNTHKTVYKVVQVAGEQVIRQSLGKGRAGEVITCDQCHNPLTNVEKQIDWTKGAPAFGSFASMTPSQRGEVLAKRSKDHFQREGKDVKNEMLKASGLSR